MAILFGSNSEGKFLGRNINNHTFGNVIGVSYSIVHNRVKTLAKNFTE